MGNSASTVVALGSRRVRVKRQLAEGGYGFVYKAEDERTKQDYALKMMRVPRERNGQLVSAEAAEMAEAEQTVVRSLPQHLNVVAYVDSGVVRTDTAVEFYILSEFCSRSVLGMLMDAKAEGKPLEEAQALCVFRDALMAVQHLHAQSPPCAHRDLKLENLLIGADGRVKLCDFGSCSRNHRAFKGAREVNLAKEEIRRHTTPAYRAPEQVDLFQGFVVGEKVDIWALGVLLYKLFFFRTPFEDVRGNVEPMGILNGLTEAKLPPESPCSDGAAALIRLCMKVNPNERPTATELLRWCEEAKACGRLPLWPEPDALPSSPLPAGGGGSSSRHGSTGGSSAGAPLPHDSSGGGSLGATDLSDVSGRSAACALHSDTVGSSSAPDLKRLAEANTPPSNGARTAGGGGSAFGFGASPRRSRRPPMAGGAAGGGGGTLANAAGSSAAARQGAGGRGGGGFQWEDAGDSSHHRRGASGAPPGGGGSGSAYGSGGTQSPRGSRRRAGGGGGGAAGAAGAGNAAPGEASWMDRVGEGLASKWYKLLGGEQRFKLWVLKTTTRQPSGPKPKYVRKIVLALWDGQLSLGLFFTLLRYRPLAESSVVATKALTTVIKVLQQGPPHCLAECSTYADVIDEIGQMWASVALASSAGAEVILPPDEVTAAAGAAAGAPALAVGGAQDLALAVLIVRLANTMVLKVRFHQHHPEYGDFFTSPISADEAVNAERLPIGAADETRALQVTSRLLAIQASIIETQRQIFAVLDLGPKGAGPAAASGIGGSPNDAQAAAAVAVVTPLLLPLFEESYLAFSAATRMLMSLCESASASSANASAEAVAAAAAMSAAAAAMGEAVPTLEALRTQYEAQLEVMRAYFARGAEVQEVSIMTKLPVLPASSPLAITGDGAKQFREVSRQQSQRRSFGRAANKMDALRTLRTEEGRLLMLATQRGELIDVAGFQNAAGGAADGAAAGAGSSGQKGRSGSRNNGGEDDTDDDVSDDGDEELTELRVETENGSWEAYENGGIAGGAGGGGGGGCERNSGSAGGGSRRSSQTAGDSDERMDQSGGNGGASPAEGGRGGDDASSEPDWMHLPPAETSTQSPDASVSGSSAAGPSAGGGGGGGGGGAVEQGGPQNDQPPPPPPKPAELLLSLESNVPPPPPPKPPLEDLLVDFETLPRGGPATGSALGPGMSMPVGMPQGRGAGAGGGGVTNHLAAPSGSRPTSGLSGSGSPTGYMPPLPAKPGGSAGVRGGGEGPSLRQQGGNPPPLPPRRPSQESNPPPLPPRSGHASPTGPTAQQTQVQQQILQQRMELKRAREEAKQRAGDRPSTPKSAAAVAASAAGAGAAAVAGAAALGLSSPESPRRLAGSALSGPAAGSASAAAAGTAGSSAAAAGPASAPAGAARGAAAAAGAGAAAGVAGAASNPAPGQAELEDVDLRALIAAQRRDRRQAGASRSPHGRQAHPPSYQQAGERTPPPSQQGGAQRTPERGAAAVGAVGSPAGSSSSTVVLSAAQLTPQAAASGGAGTAAAGGAGTAAAAAVAAAAAAAAAAVPLAQQTTPPPQQQQQQQQQQQPGPGASSSSSAAPTSSNTTRRSPSGARVAIARYEYDAQGPEQISFKVNDVIRLKSDKVNAKGWGLGEINGKVGWFPGDFVVIQDAAALPDAAGGSRGAGGRGGTAAAAGGAAGGGSRRPAAAGGQQAQQRRPADGSRAANGPGGQRVAAAPAREDPMQPEHMFAIQMARAQPWRERLTPGGKQAYNDLLSFFSASGMTLDFREMQLKGVIGSGAFAVVFKAVYRQHEVAVKKLVGGGGGPMEKTLRDFKSECALLSRLKHRNIIALIGATLEPVTCVMEYCSRGNLMVLLSDMSIDLPWRMKRQMALDCAMGMQYLHNQNPVIIHRDLKSLNVLIDENWITKVTDFGLSRFKATSVSEKMTGQAGTYHWMAPEVINSQHYTEKADVFSFGIILWEIYTRAIPYDGMQPVQVVAAVLGRGERPRIPSTCPQPLAALMVQCWHHDPNMRPSFSEVVPWLSGI